MAKKIPARYTKDVNAARRFVDSRKDIALWLPGWHWQAMHEAFLAGCEHVRNIKPRRRTQPRAGVKGKE